jgi:hypothetical protein
MLLPRWRELLDFSRKRQQILGRLIPPWLLRRLSRCFRLPVRQLGRKTRMQRRFRFLLWVVVVEGVLAAAIILALLAVLVVVVVVVQVVIIVFFQQLHSRHHYR